MLDVPLIEQKVNWEDCYPRALLDEIEVLHGTNLRHNAKIGARRFLVWLASSGDAADARVRARFWGEQDHAGVPLFATDVEHARLFENALCRWRDEFLSQECDLKLITRTSYIRAAVLGLRSLVGDHHIDGIPKSINSGWAPTKKVRSDATPSLGAANLLRLDTVDPNILTGAENERASKDAVREACLEEFLFWERIFQFGQGALSGAPPPEGADPFAYDAFVHYLREVAPNFRHDGGTATDQTTYKRLCRAVPSLRQSVQKFLLNVANLVVRERDITLTAVLRACFGPTRRCTLAAFGVVVCDIGWNVQPLADLPRNPFVFGGSRGTVIAGAEIIESFKNRAKHHVLTYVGERTLSAGAQDILEGILREVVPDFESSSVGKSYARLKNSDDPNSTINILDRYSRMADALRDTFGPDLDRDVHDYFWIYNMAPGRATALRNTNPHWNSIFADHPLLSLPGIYPAAIRATFINLYKNESGSFDLARAAAQHANSATLMPHYLNTPAENARLDESIRLFQASVQAIAVRELDQERVALVLEQEPALFERMRHMAAEAGIAHAFGLYPAPPEEKASAPRIEFIPSAENLLELYLVRRKLREMRISLNQDRFRREFLPFLALTIVIVRELLKKGCRPVYRAAVMRACGMLRKKKITLPALED